MFTGTDLLCHDSTFLELIYFYSLMLTDLNVPVPVPHVVKAQLVCDLSRVHGLQQIRICNCNW